MPHLAMTSRRQLLVVSFCTALLTLGGILWILHARGTSAAAAPAGLRIVSAPSPHYTRSKGRTVDTVVIHYTSGINVDRDNWADPRVSMRIFRQYRVSAHYLIDRKGTMYRLVDERNIAWHAGGSIMPAPDNRRNVNRFSIGIEVIATASSGFTDAEYRALASLINDIKRRHRIKHLVGHDDIAGERAVGMGLRRDVKRDPGAHFDWGRLQQRLAEED
ncbi:MAG: N-acetylmuramoyl-L-alanine amidase [Armatimonadota bacterium]